MMLFIVELILLTTVFGENPVCSYFELEYWVKDYMPYGCKIEAGAILVSDYLGSEEYHCCHECQECFKLDGGKCIVDESQWPDFDEICTGSINYCKKEKQQGNCGEACICEECEDNRIWDRKDGIYACYTPEELNPDTPEIPEGDDVCLTYSCEQICSECAPGYTLNNDGACIPNNCYSYNIVNYVKGQCLQCDGGYLLKGGACVEIQNDNCTDYFFNGECYHCKPGFNNYNHVCVPQYCRNYVPNGANVGCTSCEWNYKLVSGICVLNTDNNDNVDCLESITYKYDGIYHTHCTKCPEGYFVGSLKSYCRKADVVRWEYNRHESGFMCRAHCKNSQISYTENYANCICLECDDYYERVDYLGNGICLPSNCVEPLIPRSSNVLDLDGAVHCGKCIVGYEPSMNIVTGSVCLQTTTDPNEPDLDHNDYDNGSFKVFIFIIVMLLLMM